MKFKKLNLLDKPYVGVFATVNDDYGLFPKEISKNDEKIISEALDIEIIKYDLAGSVINGVISKIYGNKILLSKVVEKADIKFLEKQGFDVYVLNSYSAVGNLTVFNKNGLLLSKDYTKEEVSEIEHFLNMKAEIMNFGDVTVIGSAIAINDKSIAVSPEILPEEFEKVKKLLKVEGNIATVNFGDGLVGNGLLVNNKGVIIGEKTTGFEIIRLDDIFG